METTYSTPLVVNTAVDRLYTEAMTVFDPGELKYDVPEHLQSIIIYYLIATFLATPKIRSLWKEFYITPF